jgi:hypothetical protein
MPRILERVIVERVTKMEWVGSLSGGVDVELLRQLSQCSIALDGGKRYLRLKGRCVVPARSCCHGLS